MLSNTHAISRDFFQYETIKFGGRIEILDREGHVAVFSRHQRIRFLEDGVGTFFDRVWGDGVLFANYVTKGMRILDAFPTRRGYIVALSLPRRFSRGETFEVMTQRRIVGAFLPGTAYWESAMQAPTDLLAIDVLSTRGRNIRVPEIIAPPVGDFDADSSPGRVRLRVKQPVLDAPYKLSWDWN